MTSNQKSTTPEIKLDVLALREEWRKLTNYACFWSSPDNEKGLRLTPTIEGGKVFVQMVIKKHHSGFPGIAHGGIAYTIVDGLMGWWLMSYAGRAGFTTTSTTRYKGPLLVDKNYEFTVTKIELPSSEQKPGFAKLLGQVFEVENPKRVLIEIEAEFFMPNRATAEKVMGIKIGDSEGIVFPW